MNGITNGITLRSRPVREIAMRRLNGSVGADETDLVAAEEPLEIQVEGHSIAIVMRTPGEDHELAAGFLVTEGLLHSVDDLVGIGHRSHCLVPERAAVIAGLNGEVPGKFPAVDSP